MARILITSGPTRQHIDPVRYLSNASSGRMGTAIVEAALFAGHEVVVVSGPVDIEYPSEADVKWVTSTEDMLAEARLHFVSCQGVIGVAAPCDYRPIRVAEEKISKTGEPLTLQLVETPDIMATLGAEKRQDQWAVGFALNSEDRRFRAITKLEKKRCDLIVMNLPDAMDSETNDVEVLDPNGNVAFTSQGTKAEVGRAIFRLIQERLITTD